MGEVFRTQMYDVSQPHGRCNYDLIAHLRARRLRWLGHILRLPETELLRQIVEKLSWPKRHKQTGGIFMDAPQTTSQDNKLAFGELTRLAGNGQELLEESWAAA